MDRTRRQTIKVSRSVTDIDRRDWDALFPPHPENYDFFKTIDQTLTEQFTTYYISIYDEDGVSCIAPCFTADYLLDTTIGGFAKSVIRKTRNIFPGFMKIKIFACGYPLGEGRIGIRPSADKELTIRTLVREMRRLAIKDRAAITAFRDFSAEQSVLFGYLDEIGYIRIESFPSTSLRLNYASFDEYLASLSKATRIDLRRKFKRARERANITVEVKSDFGDLLDEAYRYYLGNIDNADTTFEVITKDFLKKITDNMSSEVRCFIFRVDGRFAAFHLCLVSNGILSGEYLGMDYSIAHRLHLYFVLMRETIDWCIKNGILCFEAGALNYDPKKRLDFDFIPQFLYFKHRNPVIHFLFRFIVIPLKPENFDPVLRSIKRKRLIDRKRAPSFWQPSRAHDRP